MRRREFMGAVGVLLACPMAASAQPVAKKIGVLAVGSFAPLGPLDGKLRELGYIEGKTANFIRRSAEGNVTRLPALAADLVQQNVDVIVTVFTPAVTAAKNATRDIPIIMAPAGNPVGTGLVASLAHPGGNVTGVSGTGVEMGTKNLELLRDLFPSLKNVAVLAHATDPFTKGLLEQLERAAKLLHIELRVHSIGGPEDIRSAFSIISKEKSQAIFIQGSIPTQPTVDLAIETRAPTLAQQTAAVRAGALMSYNASNLERAKIVADYIDKILKGTKPADLPVQQPSRYELVVNLKTAKLIGLTMPASFLARADEVIE